MSSYNLAREQGLTEKKDDKEGETLLISRPTLITEPLFVTKRPRKGLHFAFGRLSDSFSTIKKIKVNDILNPGDDGHLDQKRT